MVYSYSDMECLHRHNFLPFQVIFCFFAPLLTPKFGKFIKKHLDILSFYTCVPLIKIIWCMVPEIWSSTDAIFLPSWAIFCPFTPLTPWKMKLSKMKKVLEISSFYASVLKIMIICYTVPKIWRMTDIIVIFISGYQAFFQSLLYNR